MASGVTASRMRAVPDVGQYTTPNIYVEFNNDYVKWVTELGHYHEGWVYFKEHPIIMKKRKR